MQSECGTEERCVSSAQRMVRLINAITEAVRKMERCPDDSTQDIWNKSLESWRTGLRMNHWLEIEEELNDKSSTTAVGEQKGNS